METGSRLAHGDPHSSRSLPSLLKLALGFAQGWPSSASPSNRGTPVTPQTQEHQYPNYAGIQ